MPRWSRRSALRSVATVGSLALAGCSGESSRSNEIPRDRGEPVPDFEAQFAREADGGRLFDVGDKTDDGSEVPSRGVEYLTDGDERDDVTFRSTPAAAELRAFVDETDLEAESVYLLQQPIGECYRANLVGVYREGNGVDADFCRTLRPADVDCSADGTDTLGVAIRLPFPGDDFNSFGTGWSSECDHRPVVAREGGESP